ncbi:MAG: hypothetical protein DRP70_04750 [Spirochaetes bacterium]|nr:MAG: hypothetical protein DRP70_04750 [Spirochaetota bacterium]RKX97385.1 MAG: hypothetical protein DRZ90_06450 [Spirochaetota bacterium]
MLVSILLIALAFAFISCSSTPSSSQQVTGPKVIGATKEAVVLEYVEDRTEFLLLPVMETGRTGHVNGDADDPAIWVHPTDPARSLIFGVDKGDGLWVWNIDGEELKAVDIWGKPGNVDVRYGLELGDGTVDIVAVNIRKVKFAEGSKAAVYAINPDWTSGDDVLTVLADGQAEGNDISLGTYGMSLYQNPEDNKIYFFENASTGPIKQFLIEDDGSGEAVKLTLVRELVYPGNTCEGMVADDQLGFIYIGEEDTAVRKYYADPAKSPEVVSSFAFAEDGYSRDREGLALYECSDGTGYLLVVDQGDASNKIASIIRVYERQGDNNFVKTVALLDRDGMPMWDQDGIDSTATPIFPLFPYGVVIGHDGANSTYPLYDWRDFAGSELDICGE